MINEILAYVQTRIQTLSGLTADQVHFTDPVSATPSKLPDVEIWRIKDDPQEETTDSAGGQGRILTFGVSIAIKAKQQSATDVLAQQVLQAVLEDYTLGGLVQDTRLEARAWGTAQQDAGVSMASLTFSALYTYYRPSNW